MEKLKPWQSHPRWLVCFKCREPATGWRDWRGVDLYHCARHADAAHDQLVEAFGNVGCDGTGGCSRVRDPWGYWLRWNLCWRSYVRVNVLVNPRARRRKRENAAAQAELDALFGR